MSGKVVHFEVPYDDGDRARSFYADVFGWQIHSMPEMQYDMVSTGPVTDQGMPSEPGYVGGGMTQRGELVGRPVIDDIDDTLRRVRSSAGSAVGEPIPVGDMGVAAYFQDSDGNVIGLWENAG